MIEKTEALALRVLPHSETSRIATWLSPSHGRLSTLIKGGCRPKSPFLGQVDVGDTSEVLFYARERNGLHIAKECSRLTRRDALRRHWRQYAGAEYVCRLLLQVCVPGRHHEPVYGMAQDALDFLCQCPATPEFALQWELRLLKALGLAPQLEACPECGRKRDPRSSAESTTRWLFSLSRGGILCAGCAGRSAAPDTLAPRTDMLAAAPDVLALMRQWTHARSARSAQRTRCGVAQRRALDRIAGAFLDYHLDLDPGARRTVLSMLDREPAALI